MVDPPRPAGTARQWQIAHGQAAVDWMRSSGVARRMLDDVCQAVETVPGGRRSYRQVLGGSSALADARTLRPPWRFRSPAGSRSMSRRSRSPTHVCLQYQRSVSPVERRARSCRIAVQQGSQGGLTLISVFLPEVDNGLVRYNRGPGPAVQNSWVESAGREASGARMAADSAAGARSDAARGSPARRPLSLVIRQDDLDPFRVGGPGSRRVVVALRTRPSQCSPVAARCPSGSPT